MLNVLGFFFKDDYVIYNLAKVVHANEGSIHTSVVIFNYACGTKRYLKQQKGVMKVVRFWLASPRVH